jgi:hypothetical protein
MSRIVLVAKGEGMDQAPNKGEVWGLGTYFMSRHCTMSFEAHDLSWSLSECIRHVLFATGDMLTPREVYERGEWKYKLSKIKAKLINDFNIPFMSVAKYDENNPVQGIVVPTSIEYPLSDVISDVCKGRSYLMGSFSSMLAYAIHLDKYDHIEIYGCELASEEEWSYQVPNVEYLIGVAEGRGKRVDIMTKSSLLRTPNNAIYGYLSTYSPIVPDDADIDYDLMMERLGLSEVKDGIQNNGKG